jgi:hypothetical protein
VERHQKVSLSLDLEAFQVQPTFLPPVLCGGPEVQQRVHHDVPDAVDPVGWKPFPAKVFVGVGAGREQEVRQSVGEDPVHFLRHAPVAAA